MIINCHHHAAVEESDLQNMRGITSRGRSYWRPPVACLLFSCKLLKIQMSVALQKLLWTSFYGCWCLRANRISDTTVPWALYPNKITYGGFTVNLLMMHRPAPTCLWLQCVCYDCKSAIFRGQPECQVLGCPCLLTRDGVLRIGNGTENMAGVLNP
jgi:hypothetical protein